MAALVLSGNTSGAVTIAAPSVAGTQAYTLPTGLPAANGYSLVSTTAGTMSWAASGGGGGSPNLDGGTPSSTYAAISPIDGGTP